MILAGLVLGAALTTYLMLLQADRRATAEATAGMDESTPRAAVADSRISENHVTEGSIGPSTPSRAMTGSVPVARQPVVPAPAPVAPVAPAPSPDAAVAQGTLQQPVQPQIQKQIQPKQAPSAAVASVNVPDAGTPRVVPAQRTQRGRESLDRRTPTNQPALQGPTPETDELVRESAKLDPSLPPPVSAAPAVTLNTVPRPPTDARGTTYRSVPSSGNPATNQLVRDSAKTDPALPPPDMSAVRAALDQQQRGTKQNTNPVAAALTDQLVRDSAKLDPSLPPPK